MIKQRDKKHGGVVIIFKKTIAIHEYEHWHLTLIMNNL
jgi:hypothetical protein